MIDGHRIVRCNLLQSRALSLLPRHGNNSLHHAAVCLLLIALRYRIYESGAEANAYCGHGANGDCVTEEQHTRCCDWELVQRTNHTIERPLDSHPGLNEEGADL